MRNCQINQRQGRERKGANELVSSEIIDDEAQLIASWPDQDSRVITSAPGEREMIHKDSWVREDRKRILLSLS
jgi:hypothetical protein